MATIRSLLCDRVLLQLRSADRVFLHAYVPKLMSEGQVVRFLLDRGYRITSPALLGKIGSAYAQALEHYAADRGVPLLRFAKGDSKEELAAP